MAASHYFFAIPLPDPIKALLNQWSSILRDLPFDYKEWVHERDFHLTLKFLGGVEDQSIKLLCEEVKTLTSDFSSFEMTGGNYGTFGSLRSPRVLWAGVESDPILFEEQKLLDNVCEGHGFRKEGRPYRPHITVAKKWLGGRFPDELPPLPEGYSETWVIDRMVLYRIHPSRKPKYEIAEEFWFPENRSPF